MTMAGWMRVAAVAMLATVAGLASAAQPVVSNVSAQQRSGTKLVDIRYNVADADGHALNVAVYISGDAGFSWRIPAVSLTGAVGAGVSPGVNKLIVWDAGRDWNGQYVDTARVRVVANDGTAPAPPFNMVYIPPGPFQMGDNLMEIGDHARPVHNVEVDGFFMDRFEVSGALWVDVRSWAVATGYSMGGGAYRAPDHPAQSMSWYDAVKWCNARSEKEGLTPVYYTDAAHNQVLRSGTPNLTNTNVRWSADGYRLPTEAEWEKAARGGLFGKRYPWGDTVDGSMANYSGSGDPYEGGTATTPCGYYNGDQIPAGVDMGNGYGLSDMAGNVWEWCWDWYSGTYYGSPESLTNPRGPDAMGSSRVLRGGAWSSSTDYLRCADRYFFSPGSNVDSFGFRCVRGR